MNTKNNRRTRETDEAIVRAFYQVLEKKKAVSRVTVREICELAQVNRSTFYAHYLDVYDLLEKVEHTMSQRITRSFIDTMDAGGHLNDCYEALFEFIKKYREFYIIYFKESSHHGIINLAMETYSDRIPKDYWKEIGCKSEEEFYYQQDFYIAGMSAMIRRWLENGCRETPAEMVEIMGRQYSADRSFIAW